MKISVAICTYNGEQFIEQQLYSILYQTRRPDEIIIGDDDSSDNTLDLLRNTLVDSGMDYRIIKNEKNLGVAKNFQNIILKCTGDIIFTADQDDVWLPEKVETFLNYFEKNADCVLVFSNGYVTDKELLPTGDLWECVQFTKRKQEAFNQGEYYKILLSKNYITGATMAFRRNFEKKFMNNPILTIHDYWIALHAPLYGEIGMINQPLIYYRQHETNVKGVNSSALQNKIIRWIKNSKRCLDNAEERYVMSKGFYDGNKDLLQDKNLDKKISEWVQFNAWRASLKNMNRISAAFSVLAHKLRGEYREFYARNFSGMQDFIGCLL